MLARQEDLDPHQNIVESHGSLENKWSVALIPSPRLFFSIHYPPQSYLFILGLREGSIPSERVVRFLSHYSLENLGIVNLDLLPYFLLVGGVETSFGLVLHGAHDVSLGLPHHIGDFSEQDPVLPLYFGEFSLLN